MINAPLRRLSLFHFDDFSRKRKRVNLVRLPFKRPGYFFDWFSGDSNDKERHNRCDKCCHFTCKMHWLQVTWAGNCRRTRYVPDCKLLRKKRVLPPSSTNVRGNLREGIEPIQSNCQFKASANQSAGSSGLRNRWPCVRAKSKQIDQPVEAFLRWILARVVVGAQFEFVESLVNGRELQRDRDHLARSKRAHNGARGEDSARRFVRFDPLVEGIAADAALAFVDQPLPLNCFVVKKGKKQYLIRRMVFY